jgi:hypothetical protein
MKVVITPNDYVKYILVYVGNNKNFLPGLPMKDVSLVKALREYGLEQILTSRLYVLREIK